MTFKRQDQSASPSPAVAGAEAQLAAVEQALDEVKRALCDGNAAQLEQASGRVQTGVVKLLAELRHLGGMPAALRHRVALIGAEVAAQREAVARAQASLQRTIDLLLPQAAQPASLYSAAGLTQRPFAAGRVSA